MPAHVKHPTQMLALVIGLLMVGQIGETLYLPAMPIMVHELNCTTGDIQWILSAYLIGFGGCQFIYGPLSDYFGRRPIVMWSLVLYFIGAAICVFAPTAKLLIIGAFIAGLGIGSGGLMARTAVRDLFDGPELQKAMAIVGVAIVFTPMAAPVVGAYLLKYFGWRSNFVMFMVAGLLFLLVAHSRFEETNRYLKSYPLKFSETRKRYAKVLSNPIFYGNMLCGMMNLSAIMAYEIVAPFLFQKQLGLSPVEYAWFALLPVVGFLLGSFLSGKLARNYDCYQIAKLSNVLVCLGCVVLFVPIWFENQTTWTILPALMLLMFGSGVLFSSTTTGALMPFSHESGVAGALIGGFQNMGAGILTGVMSVLEIETLLPLAVTLSVTTFLGLVFFLTGILHTRQQQRRCELISS